MESFTRHNFKCVNSGMAKVKKECTMHQPIAFRQGWKRRKVLQPLQTFEWPRKHKPAKYQKHFKTVFPHNPRATLHTQGFRLFRTCIFPLERLRGKGTRFQSASQGRRRRDGLSATPHDSTASHPSVRALAGVAPWCKMRGETSPRNT